MPSFVTRKKLHPTTIFDIQTGLWGVWSVLYAELNNKKINRKKILACMDKCCILARKCEIRLPDKKSKDAEQDFWDNVGKKRGSYGQ